MSYDDYNLACIVVLPPYQKKGYGMLLIEFSRRSFCAPVALGFHYRHWLWLTGLDTSKATNCLVAPGRLGRLSGRCLISD